MKKDAIKINDEFQAVATKTVDDRKRITLGELVNDSHRVRLYKNKRGEILIVPVVEIPASEIWLYENKQSLEDVLKGLNDLSEGRITKVDVDELKDD